MQIPDAILTTDGRLFDQYRDTTFRERTDNLVVVPRTVSASELDPDVLIFFGETWHLDAAGEILIAYGIDAADVRDSVRRIQRPGPHRSAAAEAEMRRRSVPESAAFAVLDDLSDASTKD